MGVYTYDTEVVGWRREIKNEDGRHCEAADVCSAGTAALTVETR